MHFKPRNVEMNRYSIIIGVEAIAIVAALVISAFAGSLWLFSASGNSSIFSTGIIDAFGQANTVQYTIEDRIFEANGSEVVWRGAGGSYLFHTDDHLSAWNLHLPEIQKMGLNTVRLAFRFPNSNPGMDGYVAADTLDYAKLNDVLGWLDKHNIKAILCCMNYRDMLGDFGSQKLKNDWMALASRHRGDSRIVAYELFNEPGQETWDMSWMRCRENVTKAYADLTDAVRVVDPEHIVIWQSFVYLPFYWDIDKFAEALQPYLRSNLVFTVHSWLHKESSFDIWNPEQMSYISVEYLVMAREKLNVPFWLGEFGSYSPFNLSNTEYQWTEQTLWRCEEQTLGWNLWMGRTEMDRPWREYLPLFTLGVCNEGLVRKLWAMPLPNFKDFVIQSAGLDKRESYRIEMCNNSDYTTLRPGMVVRVITVCKLQDGSLRLVGDQVIRVVEQLTVRNEGETIENPGDWVVKIYSIGFV
jgi:hypothetical protein